MKRKDAYRKLQEICKRLDLPEHHDQMAIATEVYLFGSVLLDKPNPGDIDLLVISRKNKPVIERKREGYDIMEIIQHPRLSDPNSDLQIYMRNKKRHINIQFEDSLEKSFLYNELIKDKQAIMQIWGNEINSQEVLKQLENNPMTNIKDRWLPLIPEIKQLHTSWERITLDILIFVNKVKWRIVVVPEKNVIFEFWYKNRGLSIGEKADNFLKSISLPFNRKTRMHAAENSGNQLARSVLVLQNRDIRDLSHILSRNNAIKAICFVLKYRPKNSRIMIFETDSNFIVTKEEYQQYMNQFNQDVKEDIEFRRNGAELH